MVKLKVLMLKGFLSLSLLTVFLVACSRTPEIRSVKTPEVSVSLEIQESPSVAYVKFKVSDGWHVYGPHQQKNGKPTVVALRADDKEIDHLVWPETTDFDEGASGLSQGYSGEFTVSAALKEPADVVAAKISWAACKDRCVPGSASLMADTKNHNTASQP